MQILISKDREKKINEMILIENKKVPYKIKPSQIINKAIDELIENYFGVTGGNSEQIEDLEDIYKIDD